MAKSNLTTSTLSLGSGEKAGNLSKISKDSLEVSIHHSEDGYVTKRRIRWTPQKCTSLEILTPQTRFDFFRRYEMFPNIEPPLIVRHPKIHTIWKAYSKFIKGAWKKTRSDLTYQTQKAEASELQERSALMQMSSLCAILNKDKEIMRDQTNELNELSNSVASLGNENSLLEELNCNLNLEIEILIDEVKLSDKEISRKHEKIAQLEIDQAGLEKSLFRKEEKRDKYRIEMEIKREKIEHIFKEYELNYEVIQNQKRSLEEVENNKKLLLFELNERQTCLTASNDELQRETDAFSLLKKSLVEIEDLNRITAQELNLMEMRLIDQDLTVTELEKQLSIYSEELERLEVSKAKWGKWDKLMYGMWAAACLVQVIKFLDRRWP